MAAVTTDQRKMGAMTVISSLILVAMIVWAGWSFALVSLGLVRDYDPHIEYDEAPNFGYDIPWAGGQSTWWDNINYTNAPLNGTLPDDLFDQLNNVLFYVVPEDPPQLWRSTAYDAYDGSSWVKTSTTQWSVGDGTIDSWEATNEIYRVFLNVTTGPATESLEIPILFPNMKLIRGTLETGYLDQFGQYQPHSVSRLTSYEIFTDEYGTALLDPFFEGSGEDILLSYQVTYDNQDLITVQTNALDGDQAPPNIWNIYSPVGVTLSSNVIGNASLFSGAGNAYETAIQVEQFFRSNFSLLLDDYNDRPAPGQEVTDWFLDRGGGLPMDFVTAYCVFLRQLGIPARPTLGYAIGEPMGGYREIQVQHMLFWAEVFIPMIGHPDGGEWIQVIPLPLPGTGGIPNTGQGNVEILLASSLFPDTYELIGTPFQIYAAIFVNGVPITTPETIDFYDRTDSVVMGSAAIDPSGFATLDYAFPGGSSVGMHNITATYFGPTYVVSNWTAIYAVSQPDPRHAAAESESGFFLSEEIDIDIKQGIDTYVAYWNDTLDIQGIMTDSEGFGVDGTTLNNPWMQIMWDDEVMGSAQILSDGTYRYLVHISAANATLMGLMTPGAHELWSSYSGEYDPLPPHYPIYLPARSSDNSTVTIYGAATSNLIVTPNPAYRDANLHYEGTLELFNGTILPFESVDIYFNGVYLDTRITDATGFFQYDYLIPIAHALGWFYANVTWSSPTPDIVNLNDYVPVEISLRPSDLSNMNSAPVSPAAVHIVQNITIYGHLRDGVNGTGLAGRTVDFWWDNGASVIQLGSNVTESDGWYQFTYTVPGGFEGFVDYWVNFTSLDGFYADSQSPIRTIEVKKWDVAITLEPIPDPSYRLDTILIEGIVTFSEIPWPFANANISIWWNNQTDGLRQIGWVITNSSGGYAFYYVIPLGHELGNVTIYASFESPYINVASAESPHAYPDIQTRPTILTVDTIGGLRVYYINETVYVFGQLLDGGTPIVGEDVTIYWDNGTLQSFIRSTNSTGYYNLTYPLSLSDGVGTITISVDYAGGGVYDPAATSLFPDITTQLYQTDIAATAINGVYHLDEVLSYSGQLTFPHNGNPIPGATVIVHYVNGTGEFTWAKTTDGSGWFSFQYNFTLTDALGGILIWSEYTSTDPLWADANSGSQSANVELYQLELNAFAPGAVFLDRGVLIQGWLTYLGGVPPLAGEVVDVYISATGLEPWSYLGSDTTNGTGYFSYTHYFTVPPDSEGDYYFKCNYTSTSPLNADAATGAMQVTAQRYQVTLDVFLSANPIYQNETLTISAHLYFAINGTNISGEAIEFYWFNGTTGRLDSVPVLTDAGGWALFVYSSMSMDTERTGIEVYTNYDGSLMLRPRESPHETLTLWQWQTVISGFDTGAPSYYILQTIPITGTLTYVVGPSSIGGVFVDILVDGNPVGNTLTASDGSFSFNWPIPESASPGNPSNQCKISISDELGGRFYNSRFTCRLLAVYNRSDCNY
ncbi:MAG: transglutaminase domain-containing protein [Candidatus Thorarchaeota archaeon]